MVSDEHWNGGDRLSLRMKKKRIKERGEFL